MRSVFGCFSGMSPILLVSLIGRVLCNVALPTLFFQIFPRRLVL
jgi:hypothetical protein